MVDAFIRFDRVSKSFGSLRVIQDLSFSIERGEFVSLLGPSGSGKTTLLMLLAGFEAPTAGSILVEGQPIERLPPYRRNMGVVFQNYALFPHMTVAENIAFPLKMRGLSRAETRRRVERALDMVRLGALIDRRPSQLSGGQQQRIALARALVFEPRVVLMDEPLGALDKQLREHMQLELRELHRRLGLTIVFVTHDQSEALTMSDRVAVFNEGRIEQVDTPSGIYDRPQTRFVAQFIGETNLLEGKVLRSAGDRIEVAIDGGHHVAVQAAVAPALGEAVYLSLRPEAINLAGEGENSLPARVTDLVYQGDHTRVHLAFAERTLAARVDRRLGPPAIGAEVQASFAAADAALIRPALIRQ